MCDDIRKEPPTETIQERLVRHLAPAAGKRTVVDVRIGLGYTAVRLDGGQVGVAWTPDTRGAGCTYVAGAGTLAGSPAAWVLPLVTEKNSALLRAVGLATANALIAALPLPQATDAEVTAVLGISSADRVAMVGNFAPVVARLKKGGCRVDVLELNREHPDIVPPEKEEETLRDCTVAIITATTLINGTCDGVMSRLRAPRAVVLLGPSTPLCPEAFAGTGITHLAGVRVRDGEAVLRIVSEGGGTQVMKAHLDFLTVPL